MKMLGLEDYVCDYRNMNFEDLKNKVDSVWSNRKSIREMLLVKMKTLRKEISNSAKLVESYIDKIDRSS